MKVVMIRSCSRGLLAAALFLGHAVVTDPWALADDDDEDEDEGGREGDEEDEDEDGKDHPPATSGGLYTMATFPVREIERPLTITEKVGQVRLSLGTDISAKGAFDTFGVSVEGIYGYRDNFTLLGGFTSAYNMKQFGLYFGFEGSIVYDLVDIRLAANVRRNAIPDYQLFCNPPASPNEMPIGGACMNPGASQDNLPSGQFSAGGTKFSIDLGFPFRYAIKPEIAIVALHTLMSIDFNSVDRDYVQVIPLANPMPGQPTTMTLEKGNGAKPDLNPSLGIATNPVAPLSVVIFAQLRIPDFDTSAGAFQVPVTGRIQFSPNQKFDIGFEFILLNVKPPEGQSPIDNRYLALFMQSRFGK
jgi:hypothetical protein